MNAAQYADQLERARQRDPHAGIAIGSDHVVHTLMDAIADSRGIDGELLLLVLASLAGYACQDAVRELGRQEGITDENALFTITAAPDGSRHFSGERIHYFLTEGPRSVWAYVAGETMNQGVAHHDLPDLGELIWHVSRTVGTAEFGVVRYPPGRGAGLFSPIEIVRDLWPVWESDVRMFCPDPTDRPELFAEAVRRAMRMGQHQITPRDAARIAMEAAVPMSTVDLQALLATRPAFPQP